MGANLSYFDLAENDYQFLKYDRDTGRVGNIMCSSAQNICERYLKHVIDTYVQDSDATKVLQTHSLRVLRRFIREHLPEFQIRWNTVLQADGYYFSTRYPGSEAFLVDREDVDECWEAVEETRDAVIRYIEAEKDEPESRGRQ